MNNPRLATRYAKSIIDLAIEKDQLDNIYADMKLILRICKSNPDFVIFLKSPIINTDKKQAVLKEVFKGNIKVSTGGTINCRWVYKG